jgi:Ca-activated chloride channel family protein
MKEPFSPPLRSRLRWIPICLSCILIVCTSLTGLAQEQPSPGNVSISARRAKRPETPAASIRMEVNRVLIPVTVTDTNDRKVEGLRKQDFRLFENGVEQELSEFFIDESPVSIGLVLDVSKSMRDKLERSRQVISAFMRMSSREDEFFLVSFNDRPELVHGFTTNAAEIEHEMEGVLPIGWTALYDAMHLAIGHMKRAKYSHRVLLVLSDGEDNYSRYTEAEMKNIVREAGVRIFSISILNHAPALEKLAAESGGRGFRVRKIDELPGLAVALSAEVHGEYVLGFNPTYQERDGKYRTVRVEVVQPAGTQRVHASWRRGYYTPLQ